MNVVINNKVSVCGVKQITIISHIQFFLSQQYIFLYLFILSFKKFEKEINNITDVINAKTKKFLN